MAYVINDDDEFNQKDEEGQGAPKEDPMQQAFSSFRQSRQAPVATSAPAPSSNGNPVPQISQGFTPKLQNVEVQQPKVSLGDKVQPKPLVNYTEKLAPSSLNPATPKPIYNTNKAVTEETQQPKPEAYQPPADYGGKFINFSQILSANRDKIKGLGDKLANRALEAGRTGVNAINQAKEQADAALRRGTKENPYFIKQTNAVNEPFRNLLKDFSGQDTAYSGPQEASGFYTNAQKQAALTKEALASIANPDNLQAYLQQQFRSENPGYSLAQSQLDRDLLGSTVGNKFTDITKNWSGFDKMLNPYMQQTQSQIQGAQQDANIFGNKIQEMSDAETKRLAEFDKNKAGYTPEVSNPYFNGPKEEHDWVQTLSPDDYNAYVELNKKFQTAGQAGADPTAYRAAKEEMENFLASHGRAKENIFKRKKSPKGGA